MARAGPDASRLFPVVPQNAVSHRSPGHTLETLEAIEDVRQTVRTEPRSAWADSTLQHSSMQSPSVSPRQSPVSSRVPSSQLIASMVSHFSCGSLGQLFVGISVEHIMRPISIGRLNLNIVCGFRLKSLTLMACQSLTTLLVAYAVDLSYAGPPMYIVWATSGGACVFVLVSTFTLIDHYPHNYIGCAVLALCLGTAVGFSAEVINTEEQRSHGWASPFQSPLFVFMFIYVTELFVVAMIICPKLPGDKVFRSLPVTLFVAILGDILILGVWTATEFCPYTWLVITLLVVPVCLAWNGFEVDRLNETPNPDNYLALSLLVWMDLFALATGVMAIVVLMFTREDQDVEHVREVSDMVDDGTNAADVS